MVLVDETLRCDGLLEKGNDWFVHSLAIVPSALNSEAFVGLLEGWRTKLAKLRPDEVAPAPLAPFDLGKMSIGEIAGKAKPAEMWALLAALVTALAGAFALGVKLAS